MVIVSLIVKRYLPLIVSTLVVLHIINAILGEFNLIEILVFVGNEEKYISAHFTEYTISVKL